MLLRRIILHNFGAYRDRHEIELAPPSSNQPITLFGGLNGAGKTTLLDALQLALYGKRARCAARGTLGYEEYLRRSVHRSVAGREGAALELYFNAAFDGELVEFHVHRSWEPSGRSVKEHVAVRRDGRYSQLLTERWDEIIEELMPLEIASLFFFDGEKIEALADPERAGRVISTAIESLLGLGLLQRLQTDLVALERKKRAARLDDHTRVELENLVAEVALAREARTTALQQQATLRNEVDRAEASLTEARQRFQQGGGELFDKDAELKRRLATILDQLNDVEHQLVEHAAGSLPLLLVGPLLDRVVAQRTVERQAERAEIVATELAERDERLIKAVGGALSEDARALLTGFMSTDRARNVELASQARYLEAAGNIDHRLAYFWPHEVERSAESAERLLGRRAALQAEADEIERMLAAVPAAAAIAQLRSAMEDGAQRLGEVSARFQVASENVADAKRRVEQLEAKRERVEQDLTRELEAEEEARRVIEHSGRVRDTVDQFRTALIARHLSRIESAVLDSLQRLLRKQRLVEDLRIDPESFQLSLYDRDEKLISPDRLSAGERQLLAVAMLWGLARVSGRQLPTIIDTPLGRLDSRHRRLLAERYFPEASHQVLLLSTDEEIDEALLEVIHPAVGHCYELRYDDSAGSTSVLDGYFGAAEVSHVA